MTGMNKLTFIVRILNRLFGTATLVLGITFWTGHALQLIPLHMLTGSLVVLGLWAIALSSLRRPGLRGLSVFAIIWGAVVPLLGIFQYQILPGDSHWVISVVHLIAGMIAMGLTDRLAKDASSSAGSKEEYA
jgi:hypothetical protein